MATNRLALGGRGSARSWRSSFCTQSEVVSTDRLVEELWGENPPETGPKALQVAVSQVRKTLQSAAGANGRLVTRAPGYALRVGEGELDRDRFERPRRRRRA